MDKFNSGFDGGDISDVEIDISADSEIAEAEPALDEFEQKIEALSLDELNIEREKLVEMGALDGEELARQYDELIAEQAEQEQFERMTEGLSKAQLEEMKEQLLSENQEMLDIWGMNNDSAEDAGETKVLKR